MAELKPGWTRYWCHRCRRGLVNDPSLKSNPGDTVTPRKAGRWLHDHCGGSVSLSMRDVADAA